MDVCIYGRLLIFFDSRLAKQLIVSSCFICINKIDNSVSIYIIQTLSAFRIVTQLYIDRRSAESKKMKINRKASSLFCTMLQIYFYLFIFCINIYIAILYALKATIGISRKIYLKVKSAN